MKSMILKMTPDFLLNYYRSFRKKQLIKNYIGDRVYCHVCESSFRGFAPCGLNTRHNAKCIKCGSRERHRLLWKYLDEQTPLFDKSEKRLLHFAPEQSFYKKITAYPNIDYVPCDLYPEQYQFHGKVEVKKVDITNIPFEDSSFDVVFCNNVLEHIQDDLLAMSELHRVMKTGSWGIFLVPIDSKREFSFEDASITDPKEREKIFGQYDHVRIYGRDYIDRLRNSGFKVSELYYAATFTKEEQFKYGFKNWDVIFLVEK
jgi:SAM-dependent methyltransferase